MIVGTAGHIDHGKTALVRALTGVDADRLAEEKARGITIDLGFAYHALPDGQVLGFVDVPGHEKLIHNMLAGATGIDHVLLVVAADDGPMPQTREHLQILDLLGLHRGAVALTKIDVVAEPRIEQATQEIRSLLQGTALADVPVFPVSALTGIGVGSLLSHLVAAAATTAPRVGRGRFRLAVDRCFTLAGSGTVVTGTVFSGQVRVGDQVVISPPGIAARVRGIHAQNRAAEEGRAGQRCALNLAGPGIEKDAIRRGDWVLNEAAHAPTARLDARLRLLASEAKPLRHWTPVHVHLATADVIGRVALLEHDALAPGDAMLAQLVLDRPLAALRGDRFIIRDQSARRTLGGGIILDPFAPPRGRRTPERLAVLAAQEEGTPEAALQSLLAAAPAGIELDRFKLSWNLTDAEADALTARVPTVVPPGASIAFSPGRWQTLRHDALDALDAYHAQFPDVPGPDPERLRRAMAAKPPKTVLARLVEELSGEALIARDGPWLRLPEHAARLSAADEQAWARVSPLLRHGGFHPPRVRDIACALSLEENAVRQLLRRVARVGKLVLVAHDHYFLRETLAELASIAQSLARGDPGGQVLAAEFRDRIGTGRKLAIQILEYFDRAGFTLRIRDCRRVRQDYAAVFGEAEEAAATGRPHQRPPGIAGADTDTRAARA